MLAEPPQNGEYLAAAYVITVVILLGYFGALSRKAKKVLGDARGARGGRLSNGRSGPLARSG